MQGMCILAWQVGQDMSCWASTETSFSRAAYISLWACSIVSNVSSVILESIVVSEWVDCGTGLVSWGVLSLLFSCL